MSDDALAALTERMDALANEIARVYVAIDAMVDLQTDARLKLRRDLEAQVRLADGIAREALDVGYQARSLARQR